jgi:hypothetical protein
VDRALDDEANADRRREMENPVGPFHEGSRDVAIRHGSGEKLEERVLSQRLEILDPTGRKVVEDEDSMALREKSFHEMAADEARAARDEVGFFQVAR